MAANNLFLSISGGAPQKADLKGFRGFTLAEVLITLVIIGVIAALTIPALMANHRKEATASKLKKFFTTMTQAKNLWAQEAGMNQDDIYFPDDAVNNADNTLVFFNNNLSKYLSLIKVEKLGTDKHIRGYLNDGSCFISYIPTNEIMFYFYFTDSSKCTTELFDGKTSFIFAMMKTGFFPSYDHRDRNYTREYLLNTCKNPETAGGTKDKRHNCTELIQIDGWQIKDDYPVRI